MTKIRPPIGNTPPPRASDTRRQSARNTPPTGAGHPQARFDFGDPVAQTGDELQSPQAGLVPLPGSAGAPLTPEQKRFRKLSGQVASARESLERFKQQAREYEQRQAERTRPLIADLMRCGEVLLRAMDAFDGAQKLSPAQRRTLRRSITELAVTLIDWAEGRPPDGVLEIHDRYARKTHAQKVQEDKLAMQAMLGEALGEDLGDALLSDEELTERVAQAMAAQARRAEEAEAADDTDAPGTPPRRRPGAAGRAARNSRAGPTATAQRHAAQAQQFTQSVREVYRKLASALHPDRVQEGPEREAMTALMQQANQAYEAKDLLTLLDLQARLDSHAAGDATQRVMGLSAATLRHYNQLLEQALGNLRSALLIEQDHLLASHPGLAHDLLDRTDGKTRAEVLAKAGQDELRALQLEIEEAQGNLKALSNATSGRRWIAQQRQRHREDDENGAMDAFPSSVLGNRPPGFGPGAFGGTDDVDPFNPPRRGRKRSPPDDDIPY